MRLAVDPRNGQVRLTLPPRASLKKGLAWAQEHQGWIANQQARLPETQPLAPGAHIPFAGREIEIVSVPGAPRTPRLDGDQLLCGGPDEGLERRVERWLRGEALRVLSAETAEYAGRAGVSVTRVSIGDPKGRWGSCAASGAIRYSWRLILAPDFVRRATVAHEVAHRIHMNHSPAFHRLVETLFEADPTPARAWLRRNGAALHWVGRGATV
ncbi:SprT family zinc-dependent metalloprotease [Sphingomonas sp. HF-S4]|uniref:SprT family zinc-dependent metalloprotease n=1 Tax=Sphingomonas agrestis TaxID=3080540 RepID=A0ABU3YAZ4_9SPHN|nr:SprT family zinc-dependent metalloprotease [Sphingomonas sp. HF-S4]MDV3458578.1 SprT family zinc-dependent metalloprotease [Sphingomonas sp. HF-S4]